jgi:hypothetical protein
LDLKYDSQFKAVFDAIRQLMAPPVPKKKPIGFRKGERRGRPTRRGPGCIEGLPVADIQPDESPTEVGLHQAEIVQEKSLDSP